MTVEWSDDFTTTSPQRQRPCPVYTSAYFDSQTAMEPLIFIHWQIVYVWVMSPSHDMYSRACEPREEGAESATQHSLLLSSSNEDHMHTQIAQDDISDAHI
jgi:hypothetical protein